MPKFSDNWVVDKTLFEYVSGGSCACCSAVNLFNPEGLKGMINAISDLETDAANSELKAAEKSPWPPGLRDCVWADRLRIRHKMKKEMYIYKEFCNMYCKDDVKMWLCNDEEFGIVKLKKLFQIPRSEVAEIIEHKYSVASHFKIVLCSVMEQVQHFKDTKYDTDGRGIEEIAFENNLKYDRRMGFTIPLLPEKKKKKNNNNGSVVVLNLDILCMFLDMMYSLGGPKLLARGPKSTTTTIVDVVDNDDDHGDADDPEVGAEEVSSPSFRADRRIIRLLIARYWADLIMNAYKKAHEIESPDN